MKEESIPSIKDLVEQIKNNTCDFIEKEIYNQKILDGNLIMILLWALALMTVNLFLEFIIYI